MSRTERVTTPSTASSIESDYPAGVGIARTPSGKLGPMRDEESMADERAEVTILPVIDMHTASTTADPAYVVASANATTSPSSGRCGRVI